MYTVIKAFSYAADGIIVKNVPVGTVLSIHPQRAQGLEREGFITPFSADETKHHESAPETGAAVLRDDGPTIEEYVSAGYQAANYPPAGYASKSSTEAIAAAIETQASAAAALAVAAEAAAQSAATGAGANAAASPATEPAQDTAANTKDDHKFATVEIIDAWRHLDWGSFKSLASKLSDDPITTKESATMAIEAELARRAKLKA